MSRFRSLPLIVAAALACAGAVPPTRAEAGRDDKPLALLENNARSNDLGAVGAPSAETAGANDSAPAKPAMRGNPLWAIPLRMLSATRERPLFSPSRRPPAPAVAAAPAPAPPPPEVKPAAPERPPMTLVGTIIGENEKVAIFFNQATNAVTRVREGEEEAGWRVRLVEQRATIVEKGDQSITLDLPKRSDERPAGIPAPAGASDNL